jgi:hypothetical protein
MNTLKRRVSFQIPNYNCQLYISYKIIVIIIIWFYIINVFNVLGLITYLNNKKIIWVSYL